MSLDLVPFSFLVDLLSKIADFPMIYALFGVLALYCVVLLVKSLLRRGSDTR